MNFENPVEKPELVPYHDGVLRFGVHKSAHLGEDGYSRLGVCGYRGPASQSQFVERTGGVFDAHISTLGAVHLSVPLRVLSVNRPVNVTGTQDGDRRLGKFQRLGLTTDRVHVFVQKARADQKMAGQVVHDHEGGSVDGVSDSKTQPNSMIHGERVPHCVSERRKWFALYKRLLIRR